MSKITDVFKLLSHGSIGAVQNGCQLSDLAQYLNVNRMIEENMAQAEFPVHGFFEKC